MKIKLSEILGAKPKVGKKARITLGLIITGILSIILIFVTVYGQFTGNYLITVTRDAHLKGIAISETMDFPKEKDILKIKPLSEVLDIIDTRLDIEAAENQDGQYENSDHYIAYTFYLKNTGQETVNINYKVKIIDDYRKIGDATFFKIRERELIGDEFQLVERERDFVYEGFDFTGKDKDLYSKVFTGKDIILDLEIINFKPNDMRKFTFFVWLDGDFTTDKMIGGAVKLEMIFTISTAEQND